MTEWKKYQGTDAQIAEINSSKNGFIFKYNCGNESPIWIFDEINKQYIDNLMSSKVISSYWIIPDDPLREMKIRWAQTGQPVWIRKIVTSVFPSPSTGCYPFSKVVAVTSTPDWNIPNAEYSFTEFKD